MTVEAPHTWWHPLPRLAELPGPEWRLPHQQRGDLRLVRAFEHYVETVCVDGAVVAVSRQPIAGRSPNTVATQNFAGSISEAIEFLRQRPCTRTRRGTHPAASPGKGDETTIAWPGDELASSTPTDMEPPDEVHASAQSNEHLV